MNNHKIRNAKELDSGKIAEAFLMAGGEVLTWIFGENRDYILKELTKLPKGPFSYLLSYVIEKDGEVAGVVVTYPIFKETDLNNEIDDIWPKFYNFVNLIGFAKKVRTWERHFKKPKTSYYIHAIAVFELHRRQGLAEKLLERVEQVAKKIGQSEIALEVVSGNITALRLYDKFGFKKIKTVPVRKLSRFFSDDERVIYLMVKKI